MLILLAIELDSLIVGVEGTDVEATGRHGPGVHGGVINHIVGEVTGGILATAVLDRMAHQVEVLLQVDIEGRDRPMGFGDLGFFLHTEDAVVSVELDDTCALEFFYRGLLMTHDAGGAFFLGEIHELLEGEEEEVIGSDDEEVIIDAELIHREEEITDSTKAGVVGLCAIVDHGNWLFIF